MADDKRQLHFNDSPIARPDAEKKLTEIYGTKRVEEILTGLQTGKYGCASVAGGHLVLRLPDPPAPAAATPPATAT